MPLVYQHNINEHTKLGVWYIVENEEFFLQKVSLQKEITHWHKRLQHLAGRYLLLELCPDFPVGLIQIPVTKKPFLLDEKYHFSISHCKDYAAVIISTNERVGVDVEFSADKIERIKHKFLSKEEMQLINPNRQQLFLTIAWSIKEALYKWYGLGSVDFIKDMCIEEIYLENNKGIANCSFMKEIQKKLSVDFLILNGNCLAWVCSVP